MREGTLDVGGTRPSRWRRITRWLDPNDDETAEPVSAAFVLTFAVLLGVSTWTFLRFPIVPMQDLGHHAALVAIVVDWGRPGSIYTDLYAPFDPLYANSLVYSVAGVLGRFVPVMSAVRACVVFYLVGTPVATFFALRSFGRSPWPAVLAIALVYDMSFVAGFVNFLFAAPFLLVSVATYARYLERPSLRRGLATSLGFACTFLAHAHVYLFLGLVSIAMLVAASVGRPGRFRAPGPSAASLIGRSIVVAIPSLLVFGRWFARVFFSPSVATDAGLGSTRSAAGFGADFPSWDQRLGWLFEHAMRTTHRAEEGRFVVALVLLTVFSVVVSRRTVERRGRSLEGSLIASLALYFLLPENISGQHVIATRHVGIALWFLPAFLAPVPARTSRLLRGIAIAAIVAYTALFLRFWNDALVDFERTEAAGLETVLRAMPPRTTLTYAKTDPESAVFRWRPFWHVEKLYMAERFGETPDTPAIYPHSPVHYRPGRAGPRLNFGARFEVDDQVFRSFELILLRRHRPTAEQLTELEARAVLVRRAGDWEVWRRRPQRPSPTP